MQFPNLRRKLSRKFMIPAIIALLVSRLSAFPPAPFYTLFGMVRDENGQSLRVDGAEVIFYEGTTEVLRTSILEAGRFEQNYQIRLPMDMLRPGTKDYTERAVATGSGFTLGVTLSNVVYYPIEMSAARLVGKPGQRVRLDLNLGIDSDGDGIPDAWEQSQLYAGGIAPVDGDWDLSRINRDGDFDGDGTSNWNEYVAGTYATESTSYLNLRITATLASHVRLKFFGIYGKVYSLESSSDLKTWTPAGIFLRDPESTDSDDVADPPVAQEFLDATATGFVDVYSPSEAATSKYYRLKVR
jgi:hypothetical protein